MWERAKRRLAASRASLDAGFFDAAVSSAYYAMLYAARAALSEEEQHAKTHSGTWNRFWQSVAASGRFDRSLASEARNAQPLREGADYDAVEVSREEATKLIELAERFILAVGELVGD